MLLTPIGFSWWVLLSSKNKRRLNMNNTYINSVSKEKMYGFYFGVPGHGRCVGPWDILPLCPHCNKKSLWIYPKGHLNIETVPMWNSFDSSKIFVACKEKCGFKTEVCSSVRDCLKSNNKS